MRGSSPTNDEKQFLLPLPLAGEGAGNINCVYTIGPAPMMYACAEATRPSGVKTIASLNTIMIDGTGMCGGCRVTVAGRPKFACVDGPEFNAHELDWPSVLKRQKSYKREENCSLEKHLKTESGN